MVDNLPNPEENLFFFIRIVFHHMYCNINFLSNSPLNI